jgi:hypothetical protein
MKNKINLQGPYAYTRPAADPHGLPSALDSWLPRPYRVQTVSNLVWTGPNPLPPLGRVTAE